MKRLLCKGLQATKELFAVVRPLFALLLESAAVLSNQEQCKADEVLKRFEDALTRMRTHAEQAETGRSALLHFLKVTHSYAPHLFFCYQIADLPKTNNDLEQAFGKVRASERRATGRRGAIPGLVVRGPVRVTTALATRLHLFSNEELVPYDLARWRQLRSEVSARQEARCKQLRFRKDPLAYLAALEERLSMMSLRS
ncbi:hypothetical protein KSC_029310 [Ktedonobacter sp. SOSP1-52]|nr:hypothetical protein KSC_029310 [Ktedonobacter sp. SOSP1-52]